MGLPNNNSVLTQTKKLPEIMIANRWAKSFANIKIKQETITQYERYFNSYSKIDPVTKTTRNDIKDINKLKESSTRGFVRASYRYFAALEILKYSLTNPKKALHYYENVKIINEDAEKNKIKFKEISDKKKPNKQTRKSKRPSLIGLPDDWVDQLVTLSKQSRYANQIKILSITGCRPAEFQNQLPNEPDKGIKVVIDDKNITFTIAGSKCSDTRQSGQPVRTLMIDRFHPLAHGLESGFYFAKSKPIQDCVRNFRKNINNVSEKDEKRKSNVEKKILGISSYTLRHQFASDLKNSDLSDDEVSAALGHQSADTKSTYGSSTCGKYKNTLISVSATLPIRQSKKSNNNSFINKSLISCSPRN